MGDTGQRVLVTLMGPTAIGKTQLGLELAARLDVALISVDSAMVYRGMDIGTAKPEASVLERVPHALVNIRDPEEGYSVSEFVHDADAAVQSAWAAGKVPVLVGGSMLYFRSFRDGLADLPPANEEIRAAIQRELNEHGPAGLYRELAAADQEAAQRIHPNNLVRLERAVEVLRLTGKPLAEHWRTQSRNSVGERLSCQALEFGIVPERRADLHKRIAERTAKMFDGGFADEVRRLMARPRLEAKSTSMTGVGYRQLWQFLAQRPDEEPDAETREAIVAATRRIARRQLVWLRGWARTKPIEILTTALTVTEILGQIDPHIS